MIATFIYARALYKSDTYQSENQADARSCGKLRSLAESPRLHHLSNPAHEMKYSEECFPRSRSLHTICNMTVCHVFLTILG